MEDKTYGQVLDERFVNENEGGGGGGSGSVLPTATVAIDGANFTATIDTGTMYPFEDYIEMVGDAQYAPEVRESVILDVTMTIGTLSTRYYNLGHHEVKYVTSDSCFQESIVIEAYDVLSDGQNSQLFPLFFLATRAYINGSLTDWLLSMYNPTS